MSQRQHHLHHGTDAKWYVAFETHIASPLWQVGGFLLALGFLAVPRVLLDPRNAFAKFRADGVSEARAIRSFARHLRLSAHAPWMRVAAVAAVWSRGARASRVLARDAGRPPAAVVELHR